MKIMKTRINQQSKVWIAVFWEFVSMCFTEMLSMCCLIFAKLSSVLPASSGNSRYWILPEDHGSWSLHLWRLQQDSCGNHDVPGPFFDELLWITQVGTLNYTLYINCVTLWLSVLASTQIYVIHSMWCAHAPSFSLIFLWFACTLMI